MAEANGTPGYGPVAIFLHWAVAVLILANLAVGWIGEEMERGAGKGLLFEWHMSLGLLVLLLSAVRLVWRWIEPPPLPLTRVRWEAGLAKTVHAGLLAVALLGPITGVAARLSEGRPVTFLGIELAAAEPAAPSLALLSEARADAENDEDEAAQSAGAAGARSEEEGEEIWQGMHALLVKPVLILLLLLHVGGALKHHFVDREDTLRRMLGRSAASRPAVSGGPLP